MILAGNDLLGDKLAGLISGRNELEVNTASVNVNTGNYIYVESPSCSNIDPYKSAEWIYTKIELKDKGYLIRPGQGFLISLDLKLEMPGNLAADFILNTSIARFMISTISNVFIEPGFSGYVTVGLVNLNQQHSIKIYPNMQIGKLRFFELSDDCKDLLNYKVEDGNGVYSNNLPEPIISKGLSES